MTKDKKDKVPPGCPFGGAGHLNDHIFHAPGAKLWHYAVELCTLSFTYPLCGLTLTTPEIICLGCPDQPEMVILKP